MPSVVLYLMNKKGWSVLSAVLKLYGKDVVAAVITARDPAMTMDYYDEIVSLSGQYNVPVYDRKNADSYSGKYKMAIGWRWIISDDDHLIVFHDSLLPRYRGFAPLVNALINGEEEVGATALFATAEYDKGEIIEQLSLTVSYPLKISDAIDAVSNLYEQLALNIFKQLYSGQVLLSYPQDEQQATYSLWREEADYMIDWNKPASFIKRFIDSVGFPFKGASAQAGECIYRIYDAVEIPDVKIENRDVGKIIFIQDGRPVVVCGEGLLRLHEMTDESGETVLPFKKFRIRFH